MDRLRKILKLVSEGKISADEANKIITAIQKKDAVNKGTLFVMHMIDVITNETKFYIEMPLGLVKMIPRKLLDTFKLKLNLQSIDLTGLDWKLLFELADDEETGTILHRELTNKLNEKFLLKIYVK
jgi:Ca2+-binding EF-hand superfamily protein